MHGSDEKRIMQRAQENSWREGVEFAFGKEWIWLAYRAWKSVEDVLRTAEGGRQSGENDKSISGDKRTEYTHAYHHGVALIWKGLARRLCLMSFMTDILARKEQHPGGGFSFPRTYPILMRYQWVLSTGSNCRLRLRMSRMGIFVKELFMDESLQVLVCMVMLAWCYGRLSISHDALIIWTIMYYLESVLFILSFISVL